MLQILGAGYYYPQTIIDNSFLADLGFGAKARDFEKLTGIKSRRSILPLDYIKDTKNIDYRAAREAATETPTDLSFKAAQMALERAGIKPDQLSCIIGDSSTPNETTPSEAQRVGERLGLRLPAYDVAASAGPIPLHIEYLSNYRDESVPEYCLCLTTNTPTSRVNYSSGDEALYFGDGAAAIVLSAKHSGKFNVSSASFANELEAIDSIGFGSFSHAKLSSAALNNLNRFTQASLEQALKDPSLDRKKIKFIGTQFDHQALLGICRKFEIDEKACLEHVSWSGFTLSSGISAVFAERWEYFNPGDTVVCAYAGVGLSYGYANFIFTKG